MLDILIKAAQLFSYSQTLSQNYEKRLLASLCLSVCLLVCPFLRMEQRGSQRKDCHEI
jgi:hypothetical protein